MENTSRVKASTVLNSNVDKDKSMRMMGEIIMKQAAELHQVKTELAECKAREAEQEAAVQRMADKANRQVMKCMQMYSAKAIDLTTTQLEHQLKTEIDKQNELVVDLMSTLIKSQNSIAVAQADDMRHLQKQMDHLASLVSRSGESLHDEIQEQNAVLNEAVKSLQTICEAFSH
ncbi:hypothetical protein ACMXYX_18120 (plasmid) [Neptuniibacter sp. QD72_48]|uniref:hypothetical protein n=1 Tax=Neptuniibacter sp. QD72_48 TaxID=3398214 RepID=UPI0039F4FAF0